MSNFVNCKQDQDKITNCVYGYRGLGPVKRRLGTIRKYIVKKEFVLKYNPKKTLFFERYPTQEIKYDAQNTSSLNCLPNNLEKSVTKVHFEEISKHPKEKSSDRSKNTQIDQNDHKQERFLTKAIKQQTYRKSIEIKLQSPKDSEKDNHNQKNIEKTYSKSIASSKNKPVTQKQKSLDSNKEKLKDNSIEKSKDFKDDRRKIALYPLRRAYTADDNIFRSSIRAEKGRRRVISTEGDKKDTEVEPDTDWEEPDINLRKSVTLDDIKTMKINMRDKRSKVSENRNSGMFDTLFRRYSVRETRSTNESPKRNSITLETIFKQATSKEDNRYTNSLKRHSALFGSLTRSKTKNKPTSEDTEVEHENFKQINYSFYENVKLPVKRIENRKVPLIRVTDAKYFDPLPQTPYEADPGGITIDDIFWDVIVRNSQIQNYEVWEPHEPPTIPWCFEIDYGEMNRLNPRIRKIPCNDVLEEYDFKFNLKNL